MSLSKTLHSNCFSSPSGIASAEMVLVIDSAWRTAYLAAQVAYCLGGWDGLRNEINGLVTRGNIV